jgi:hypothetical protein
MRQTALPSSILSPDFARARKLSRVMAAIFTVCFWGTAAILACLPAMLVWPLDGSIRIDGTIVSFASLSRGRQFLAFLAVAVNLVPALVLLHHARRVFGAFAQGAVFAPATIVHIRGSGVWLVVSFFAGAATIPLLIGAGLHEPGQFRLDFWPLIIGLTTFIAAYVMAEAGRIAAENAEIV